MIRILQVGLGPLGQKIVQLGSKRTNIKFAAAVDLNPDLIGKKLSEVCNIPNTNTKIASSVKEALEHRKVEIAILSTVSNINKLASQIKDIAEFGIPIVSTCEELSFPWTNHKRIANKIDKICKENNVACLGTGVNPGFLMDYLPCAISSVNLSVKKITISRIQNASIRRVPFQKKIGVGLTRKEFMDKVNKKIIRHVGLTESINMIAACMDWKLDKVEELIKPVIAKERVTNGFIPVKKGIACGVEQIGKGYVKGKEVIRLHFRASLCERSPVDAIDIKGVPNIKSVIEGGINGDIATSSITLNSLRSVLALKPGLHTMLDVPVPGCFQ